jgi:hypothetical protein
VGTVEPGTNGKPGNRRAGRMLMAVTLAAARWPGFSIPDRLVACFATRDGIAPSRVGVSRRSMDYAAWPAGSLRIICSTHSPVICLVAALIRFQVLIVAIEMTSAASWVSS